MFRILRLGIVLFLLSAGVVSPLYSQIPVNWTDDTGITLFQESSVVHEGSYSCGVSVNTDDQAACDLSNSVAIPVTTGATYKISFWYFTSTHVRIRAGFDWTGATATYSANYAGPTTTGDWAQFTAEGTVPAGATAVNLRLRFYDVTGFVAPETQYVDLVTFESPTGTSLPVTNGNFEQWPTLLPEPTNYPTAFSAVANNLTISLSWDDATGGQLPQAYLIKAATDPDIDPPTDGTFEIDDPDLSDGQGAVNVNYGIENFMFDNLDPLTTYYFEIYPYTNSGINVNYKTSGTPPAASATTASIIILNAENFDASWGEWTTVSVIGDQVWDRNNTYGVGGTPCAKMSGYASGSFVNEDWLISPSLNFDTYQNELLTFYSAMGYPTATRQISLKISNNYVSGDPNLATWTDLTAVWPAGNPNFVWTSSGLVNVAGFTGTNVHIAFKYVSTATESETWEIDDILITAGGSAVPYLNILSPVAGASWIRGNAYDIEWTAINTLANVTIEVTANASSGTPTWSTLGTAAANAGTWTWNIPTTQAVGSDYRIRITDNAADVTALSGIFSVTNPPEFYQIVINEIMYNPPDTQGLDDYWEWLELYNNDDVTVDLSGWSFNSGIEFIFPQGTTMAPGDFLVVARDPDTLATFYTGLDMVGPFGGALNNAGESLQLVDGSQNVIDVVLYDDTAPWPVEPDGSGPSLSLINPSLDNNLAENWLPSLENFGTPCQQNFLSTPTLLVTYPNGGEFLQQGLSYDITWSYINYTGNIKIELINPQYGNTTLTSSVAVTAQNWTWTVSMSQQIDDNYRIRISDAATGTPVDESDADFSVIEPVYIPALVITEIMYNPPETGNDSLEFIEIYNNDIEDIDLNGFYFSSGVELTFPQYLLQSGEYVVVGFNSTALQNTFGVDALQWTSGALSNSGELLELKDPFDNTIDYVQFLDVLPWDSLADGYGPSLTFCDPNLENNLGENWTHSTEFAAVNAAGDSIWASPGMGCAILPVADFMASNTSIQVGSSVTFTDLSTGNPTSWAWIFEGGTPSTFNGQNPPAIAYNTVGIFDVTLTVTNPSGRDVEVKTDYIQVFNTPPPPAANFTANVTTIFVGGSVNFTDLSTNGPTSWQWTFEGGTPGISAQQNPQNIVYNTAGTFDVTLVATNQYGSDTELKTNYITVQVIPPPQAAFTASVTTIFVGQTVTFTDQSTGNPTSWSWTFEGGTPGTSNQQNPAPVTYNTLGVFDVSLMVSNANGSTTMTKTDYINVIQPADLDLVITEIMYNPPETGTDILEFIEIYNNGSSSADLNGLYFSQGIEYQFPNQTLAPSAYFLVCVNAVAFQTAYGMTANQWTSGALSNSGETLEIKDGSGNTVDIVSFLDIAPWPTGPDGNGPSLTLCDPSSDNNDPANWRASELLAGYTPDGDPLYATPGVECEFTGINENHSLTRLSVYPNPTSGQFTLSFSQPDTWKTELFDLTGTLRFTAIFDGTTGVVQNIGLQPGIYMLKAVNSDSSKILTQKVIIN